jgi:hypothetical protein
MKINKKGNTTIIMIIIAVVILGLVALLANKGFGIGQGLFKKPGENRITGVGPQLPTDDKIEKLTTQSTSDEIDDIENDLNTTDLDSLDDELDSVDENINSL